VAAIGQFGTLPRERPDGVPGYLAVDPPAHPRHPGAGRRADGRAAVRGGSEPTIPVHVPPIRPALARPEVVLLPHRLSLMFARPEAASTEPARPEAVSTEPDRPEAASSEPARPATRHRYTA
jgi:hypothetical protein